MAIVTEAVRFRTASVLFPFRLLVPDFGICPAPASKAFKILNVSDGLAQSFISGLVQDNTGLLLNAIVHSTWSE